MIYASLHPETCGCGQLFNIADNAAPCTFAELWPQLAKWFGLVGRGPAESVQDQGGALDVGELHHTNMTSTPSEYVAKHKDTFAKHGAVNAASRGVSIGSEILDKMGHWLTFDRQLSLEKLRETGFEGDKDPVQGWLESFEKFRAARLII